MIILLGGRSRELSQAFFIALIRAASVLGSLRYGMISAMDLYANGANIIINYAQSRAFAVHNPEFINIEIVITDCFIPSMVLT